MPDEKEEPVQQQAEEHEKVEPMSDIEEDAPIEEKQRGLKELLSLYSRVTNEEFSDENELADILKGIEFLAAIAGNPQKGHEFQQTYHHLYEKLSDTYQRLLTSNDGASNQDESSEEQKMKQPKISEEGARDEKLFWSGPSVFNRGKLRTYVFSVTGEDLPEWMRDGWALPRKRRAPRGFGAWLKSEQPNWHYNWKRDVLYPKLRELKLWPREIVTIKDEEVHLLGMREALDIRDWGWLFQDMPLGTETRYFLDTWKDVNPPKEEAKVDDEKAPPAARREADAWQHWAEGINRSHHQNPERKSLARVYKMIQRGNHEKFFQYHDTIEAIRPRLGRSIVRVQPTGEEVHRVLRNPLEDTVDEKVHRMSVLTNPLHNVSGYANSLGSYVQFKVNPRAIHICIKKGVQDDALKLLSERIIEHAKSGATRIVLKRTDRGRYVYDDWISAKALSSMDQDTLFQRLAKLAKKYKNYVNIILYMKHTGVLHSRKSLL